MVFIFFYHKKNIFFLPSGKFANLANLANQILNQSVTKVIL